MSVISHENQPAGVIHKASLGEKIGGTMEEMIGKITHNHAKELEGQARKSGTHPAQHDIPITPTPDPTSTSQAYSQPLAQSSSQTDAKPLPQHFPTHYQHGYPNLNAGTGGTGESANYGNDNLMRGYKDTQPVGGDVHGYNIGEGGGVQVANDQLGGVGEIGVGGRPEPLDVHGEGNSNALGVGVGGGAGSDGEGGGGEGRERVVKGYDSMGGFPTGAPRGMGRQYSMD